VKKLATQAAKQSFKAAETEAVTRRREAKRLREALGQLQEPESKVEIGGKEYILSDIDEEYQRKVDTSLQRLNQKRDSLLKQQGQEEVKTKRVMQIKTELTGLQENLPELPEEGEVSEWEEAVRFNKEELAKLISQHQAALASQEAYPKFCPAIQGKQIECPKADICIGGDPPNPEVLKKLDAVIQEMQEQVATFEKELEEAKDRAKKYKEHLAKVQRLKNELTPLEEGTKNATTNLGDQISEIAGQIKNGEDLRDATRTYWQQQDQFEEAQTKFSDLDKEVALFDALAKAFAPDGIPSRMIAEAMAPVNELLSGVGEYFFPGRQLILTKDLNIEISGSPYATLSKSAKFRVGVAFQYVLAKLAGARLLLIDEADILDPGNRSDLAGFLLSVVGDFDNILVFATAHEAQPSPVPEIQVWWIEGGRISPVNARLAA
jgi:DNA repair exonuclease SbcCD ATPase subunit